MYAMTPDPDTPGASAGSTRGGSGDLPGGPLGLLSSPLTPRLLLGMLREVIDPELGVNIVDLGLVYEAVVVDGVAQILMTMTTPACPIGPYLSENVRWTLLEIDTIFDVEVEITHDPPWSPDLMTDLAKRQLGWLR
jgi:metal-sulfur cluster biosynthetic enzyme